MQSEESVIDADGHVLETPDLWERYLEPRYRSRAMRIRVGSEGQEYLEIHGVLAGWPMIKIDRGRK